MTTRQIEQWEEKLVDVQCNIRKHLYRLQDRINRLPTQSLREGESKKMALFTATTVIQDMIDTLEIQDIIEAKR
jgi:hypothetical protein